MRTIFVYGTLLRGFGNWSWCLKDRATFIKEAELPNFKMLHLGGFPGIIPGDSVVKGEVFTFDSDEVLRDLDRLEGHPNFYVRTPVTLADGTECETYVLNSGWRKDNNRGVVESGSWREVTGRPAPARRAEEVGA